MSESARSRQAEKALIPALICAGAGAIILILLMFYEPQGGWGFHPGQILRSWLFAWIFWFGICMGSMGVVMMHHLFGGGWGYLIRRFGETAGLLVPLMAVLFIPIIIGVRAIYPWADPAQLLHDPILRHKSVWLNWPFWTGRTIVYFIIFAFMTWRLSVNSLALDNESPSRASWRLSRLQRLSAGGEVFYFFVMALAGIDWIMSREAHWYSSVFGFILCISQAITALCFLTLVFWLFHKEEPLKGVMHPDFVNDLGSVLIVFVILWAYLSFAQFLITWLGNSQDEITWYIRRTDGGWRWIGGTLIFGHFLIPFILLLQRPLKRNINRLALVAAGLMVMRFLDVLYWVTPGETSTPWSGFHWFYAEICNVVAWIVVGAVWTAAFFWLLRGKAILPIGDRIPVAPVDHGHGQRPVPGTVS